MEGTYSWIRRFYSCALFAVASGLAVSGVRPTLLESLRQYRLHHPRDASIVHLTGVRSEINQISAEDTAKQTGKRVAEGEGEGGGRSDREKRITPALVQVEGDVSKILSGLSGRSFYLFSLRKETKNV